MQPIPAPQVLDPDRVLDNDRGDFTADHEARAALLDKALHETCAYARQLWDTTDELRAYLVQCLPPDPRSPDGHLTTSASPTGPDDSAGWNKWINAYAAATSVLCGPHGDSGFGLGEARRAAELRRTAPNLTMVADHPEPTRPARAEAPEPEALARPAANPAGGKRGGAGTAEPMKPLKLVAAAVVGVLAVRGLRR